MSKFKFYVYEYRDPRDHTPRYIGEGHGRRAYDHLNPKKAHSSGLTVAIAEWRALGFEPKPEIKEFYVLILTEMRGPT